MVLVNDKNENVSEYMEMNVACLINSCPVKCQFIKKKKKRLLLPYEFLLLPF